NKIYMSAAALNAITDKSASVTDADSNTVVTASINATYVFADADAYSGFEKQVRDMGLDDSYTVSSADLMAFESSLTPLNTLSTLAGWFLIVILIIGAVILVVLNIFNVRERKYEVGVLTAMGMKKSKVALQFVAEILFVTMLSVIFGASIGAVSSVPVTNALLSSQTESKLTQQTQIENSFGRGPGGMQGNLPPEMSEGRPDLPGFMGNAAEYITQVDSAMNLTVVLQMILIGLFLTLIASAFSVLFVMRYDPLKILSNRD
ncbi:MAG: ABC transporter permease, partial [Clostridia bacterium]|nr:ABC transporter permease [Clostridia bacterium]